MEVRPEEFADAAEMAVAADPGVGGGTPQSAPHETPFDDDAALESAAEGGVAEDDDELDEDDDDTPIDEEI